jgi:hypothetical protein
VYLSNITHGPPTGPRANRVNTNLDTCKWHTKPAGARGVYAKTRHTKQLPSFLLADPIYVGKSLHVIIGN